MLIKVSNLKTFREFITVKQAAELLGVSALTLRRWDRNGKLVSRRHPMNRYRLYDRRELSHLLRKIND
ncbi:MAG TPA: MerR family DNA-binding transcriptional regulator [Elusimicrobia bacterium]|nr:MerR family DNA-binding transcriptional regulator [Elusimicrobiota bacterium]